MVKRIAMQRQRQNGYRRCVAEWSPDITVDPELARRLIRDQFDDVPTKRLQLLGMGWDNTVYLVDEAWVFRFPRREIAVVVIQARRRRRQTVSQADFTIRIELSEGTV